MQNVYALPIEYLASLDVAVDELNHVFPPLISNRKLLAVHHCFGQRDARRRAREHFNRDSSGRFRLEAYGPAFAMSIDPRHRA